MTMIYITIKTAEQIANNNRGESDGNMTLLQKVMGIDGQEYTTVSAEAIKWSIRYRLQELGRPVNRRWNPIKSVFEYVNEKRVGGFKVSQFDDDNLFGYMLAKGAKELAEDTQEDPESAESAEPKKRVPKPKGTCNKRRGVVECTRAVSTSPFCYNSVMNALSTTDKGDTSLYSAEVHKTAYIYTLGINTKAIEGDMKDVLAAFLHALLTLGPVAGNHARFMYDFSPEEMLVRITDDPCPRIIGKTVKEPGMIFYPEDLVLEYDRPLISIKTVAEILACL